jgi:hypothetical protein
MVGTQQEIKEKQELSFKPNPAYDDSGVKWLGKYRRISLALLYYS